MTADDGLAASCAALAEAEKLVHGAFTRLLPDDFDRLGFDLEKLSRLVWAAQVKWADEAGQRSLAQTRGCPSTAALLRDQFRISTAEAALRVRTGKACEPQDLPTGGETPPVLPVLAAALDAGLLSADHARITVTTMRNLPNQLTPAARAKAEHILIGHATAQDPDQYRKVAHHLEEILNPDGTLDDRDPHTRAEFTIGTRSAATGLTPITGKLDDLGVHTLRKAIDGLSAPLAETDGNKDPRPAATRRAHALIEVCQRVLTQGDLPTHGGEKPHVTLTLNWDVLEAAAGTAVFDDGETLTPAAARRVLCDANIIPAVLGGNSEVLDLGRSSRTFNRATRRAITLRDKGCSFPGCTRPAAWTDVHHINWWHRDCGETNYETGCLLCAFHHAVIHKNEWAIQLAPDGTPEFIPPHWIDPHRKPRRNTIHHITPDTG